MIEFAFLLAQMMVGLVYAVWQMRWVLLVAAVVWLAWNHRRGMARLRAHRERERLAAEVG